VSGYLEKNIPMPGLCQNYAPRFSPGVIWPTGLSRVEPAGVQEETVMKKLLLSAALAVVMPAMAHAEKHRLFSHKAWTVDLVPMDSGEFWCDARTQNRNGDVLSITASLSHVTLWVFLRGEHWSRDFEADAKFDIDYTPWTLLNAQFVTGRLDAIVFSFEGDNLGSFLDDFYDGSAIALKSPNRSRTLATWSLAGSAASLLQLIDCRKALSHNDTYQGVGTAQSGDSYGDAY
jgi:hypothetical protein